MRQLMQGVLFIIGLNVIDGNIPGMMPQLGRFLGACCIGLWGLTYFLASPPPAQTNGKKALAACGLIVGMLGFAFESLTYPILALWLCCIAWSQEDATERERRDLTVLMITVLGYALMKMVHGASPHCWYLFQRGALWYSFNVTRLIDILLTRNDAIQTYTMTLGQNALGVWPLVSIVCYGIGLAWTRIIRGTRAIVLACGILGIHVVFLGCVPWLSKMVLHFYPKAKPTIFDFHGLLLLGWLCFLEYLKYKEKAVHPAPLMKMQPRHKGAMAGCAVVMGIAVFILSFHLPGTPKTGEILFIDKGANWSTPYYGKYHGQNSMGMFGLLPEYLRLKGYTARIVKPPLTQEMLSEAMILVVFNPGKPFDDQELKAVHAFVAEGGSLLIAGDHTDVAGVMGPINALLAPYPIRLNFDTALPLASGWVNSLEKRRHPITAHIDEDHDTSIWVGASLDIASPAYPIIVGKRGWADTGDYQNTKRAFLGDYEREGTEQLGDVVLVAETHAGKGKVMVFADTSTFQNGVLPGTYHFIDPIFESLRTQETMGGSIGRLLFALILIGGAVYLSLRSPSFAAVTVMLLTIPLIQMVSLTIDAPTTATHQTSKPQNTPYQWVYIDASHHERFSEFAPSDESVWGLSLNLMRNRLLPLYLDTFSEKALSQTDLLCVIAPVTPFTKEEIAILTRFMKRGGTLIWSVGWEESAGSKDFLASIGLSIDAVPLGKANVKTPFGQMQFVEMWAIQTKKQDTAVLASRFDYPVMLYRQVGKGGILFTSDSWLFLSKNMETYKKYNRMNIRSFRYLMRHYLKDRFQSLLQKSKEKES